MDRSPTGEFVEHFHQGLGHQAFASSMVNVGLISTDVIEKLIESMRLAGLPE